MHGSATALLCPQGAAPWLQRTSQDLSGQRPELTVIFRRALQDTDSEYRAQPGQLSGDLGVGVGTVGSQQLVLWLFLAAQLVQS